jgi:hypothetical protein
MRFMFVSTIGLMISTTCFSSDASSDFNILINSTPLMLILVQADANLFKLPNVDPIISKVFSIYMCVVHVELDVQDQKEKNYDDTK